MWKAFLGRKKVREGSFAYYYVTRSERGIYGVMIISLREEKGEAFIEWECVEGLTKSRQEAQEMAMQCKKYLVLPVNIAEGLDEIMGRID